MCAKCDTLERNLQAEILFASIERELLLAETETGESVAHAIRPLSAAERKAKMRFGEIEALEHSAAEEATKLLASSTQVYIMAVISQIFGAADAVQPAAVVEAIESLNRAQPAEVIAETAEAQKDMSAILRQVYTGASEIVIGEARRQGVKKTPKPLNAEPDRFDLLAKAVALHPWTRLTSKLQADMMNPATLMKTALAEGDPITRADVTKALEAIPLDGAVDLARQTIHTAHGAGRVEAAATMKPEEIYSSELLDGATCDACARVDGKDYDSMADALTEYETGGYGACKGGARCRGTLVFQYNGLGTDAIPAPPEPAPIPVLQPAPKTPRKRRPATPQPAPAVPDVIKTPPDAPLTRRQARELERQQTEQAKQDNPRGLPPEPTGTPPKRRKGTSQRYAALDQLPVKHANAKAKPFDIALETNPGYEASRGRDKNYSNNCSSVVQAYEFQRRGYDVKAAPVKAGKGRYDEQYVSEWWEDADGNPVKPIYVDRELPRPKVALEKRMSSSELAKAKLDEYIEAMPDGARGFVALHWERGGGHVFNFEKVDGKAVYIEGQTGRVDGSGHLAAGKFKADSLRVTRIDDKVPTAAVTEAFETRPAEFEAELNDTTKLPSVAIMKANSQHKVYKTPFGDLRLDLAKYRQNPVTKKWEEIPAAELRRIQQEFDELHPVKAKKKK